MSRPQRVAVLGSTGSIGASTLDVIARHPDHFEVRALAANRNVATLKGQCVTHRVAEAVLADCAAAAELAVEFARAGQPTRVHGGADALIGIASQPEVDVVVAGIVGAAGLRSSLAAARAGKRILLANKEALVMSG